jgi:hypothetical protein
MTFIVPDVDANVIQFQCPSCGFELAQTIGLLKAEKRIMCSGCKIDINIDASLLVAATKSLDAAVLPGPNEITIKFFR